MIYLVTGMGKVRGRQHAQEVTHYVVFVTQVEQVISRLMERNDIGYVTVHRATYKDLSVYQKKQEQERNDS